MKSLLSIIMLAIFLQAGSSLIAQANNFNVDQYNEFLNLHKDLSTNQLLEMYPAGLFAKNVNGDWESALYHDSLQLKFDLTDDEISLIKKHGFVVSRRLQQNSFGEQFLDVYRKDMPVFITTDAILHAFHSSYDRILKDIELHTLIPAVKALLADLHAQLPQLSEKYKSNSHMRQMLHDVDIYITMPRKLLDPDIQPFYADNSGYIEELMQYITDENLEVIPFFSEISRRIDFSQFKPRGHYTDQNKPELADYFRAMIWLGRMEIYLIAPRSLDLTPTFADVQRQIIDAILVRELISQANVQDDYDKIEKVISFFVGEQDNVTLANLVDLTSSLEITDATKLLDSLNTLEFQDYLKQQPYAEQKILSQVLMNHPMNPDSIVPASAFLLFGQRFIIDSYVTGNVVFDRISYNNRKIIRLLPSTLDIMFALGNEATAQLLQPELEEFHYAQNLAGLRYLISSYEESFWESTIYNMWLNGIRALNPPEDRNSLPPFMNTAAWWQQKLNTQLASWTELRHDNLLYAKQSYTGGVSCYYPYSYVEPIPRFYQAMQTMSSIIKTRIQEMPFDDENFADYITSHFDNWQSVMDTLGNIAQKELNGTQFSAAEIQFLESMLHEEPICGLVLDGWYTDLFYNSWDYAEGLLKKDFLVADYHTTPTDEVGNMVGWISHAGTGPVDMAILNAVLPSGENVAFIGPVMSYYEYTTTNFQRLTDEEWKESYLDRATRPAWTNIYLADENGKSVGDGPSLMTSTEEDPGETPITPDSPLLAWNYPNPFNNGTMIQFSVPHDLSHKNARLTIYDVQGRVITTLLDQALPSGNYFTRWEGTDLTGSPVATGIYFYALQVAESRYVGKMQLIK